MKSAIKNFQPANGAGNGHERQHKLRRHKKVEASTEKEECKTNVLEFAAAANLERAKTDVERKVIQTFGILEIRELEFEPGIEFGQAVIELRNELKKNGSRDWMKRLEELDISYAKGALLDGNRRAKAHQ